MEDKTPAEKNQMVSVPRWIFELCLAIAIEHEGDGKSKESAICFLNAKRYDAVLKLEYLYMSANGIFSNKQSAHKGGDCLYDCHSTNIGELWFRVPLLGFPDL